MYSVFISNLDGIPPELTLKFFPTRSHSVVKISYNAALQIKSSKLNPDIQNPSSAA
jgi:hypothetical protein